MSLCYAFYHLIFTNIRERVNIFCSLLMRVRNFKGLEDRKLFVDGKTNT